MRLACLTTCTVMQLHSDSMIRAESIQCLQQLHLFASKYVSLEQLVPFLLENLLSKGFLLRKVAISCLRQLCQKDSVAINTKKANDDDEDEEDYDDSQTFQTSKTASASIQSSGGSGLGSTN